MFINKKTFTAIITTLMTRRVRCCMSCAGLSWWVKVMRRKKKKPVKKFVVLQAIGDILLSLIGF